MGETVDWNNEKDPRVVQHRIRERRKQWELEETARTTGVGLLQGFTDEQLLDELERRHPEAKGNFAGSNFGGSSSLKYSQDGSGSYRYNDPVDWTQTEGAGLTADTSAAHLNATDLIHTDPHNPNLPTQEQADAVVAKAEAEQEQRAAEAGQALDGSQAQADSQGQRNAAAQVQAGRAVLR